MRIARCSTKVKEIRNHEIILQVVIAHYVACLALDTFRRAEEYEVAKERQGSHYAINGHNPV